MVAIQQLESAAMARLGEIDRTEHITLAYKIQDGKLEAFEVDWQMPPLSTEGNGPHTVGEIVDLTRPALEQGGVLLGALDGDRLAGMAVLRYDLAPKMAQLQFLSVGQEYRRQGIARRLVAEVFRLARESGAEEIYVSATPSESAVGFYHSQGFRETDRVNPELYELEPRDIHMIKAL